ncbi:MAG: DUF1731 domain-containing protein [Anaerolineae bacterium]|nr:DUF1731 domain-containing protein [Anaerolineae bacterium]
MQTVDRTIVKILTTLALPTVGRAAVGGLDVVTQAADVRRLVDLGFQFRFPELEGVLRDALAQSRKALP